MHVKIGMKTKLKRADGFKLPTEQIPVKRSPSMLLVTRTAIVRNAGIPQASIWKYDESPSIDSCAHFRLAARNHATQSTTHQTLLATLQ